MSAERTYPYTAWTLSPSFNVREVTLLRPHEWRKRVDVTTDGKSVYVYDLKESKAAAIESGRQQIRDRRAKLLKTIANIEKHETALDKAERKS